MAITAEKTKNLSCSNSSVYTYQLKVKFTETSTSTPNNTSTILITGSIGSENLAWDSYYNSYLKIYWHDNNTNTDKLVKTSDAFLSCGKNYGGTRSVSGSVTVEHKADGSLSGYAKVVFEAGSTSGGWSPSSNNVSTDTKALTTIPRASSFGTITGTTIGSNMTVNINRNASTFTHTLWYTYGDRSWIEVATDIATSQTFTLPMAICNSITDSTQGEIRLMLRTYSGTTIIGSDVIKTVSVSIPSSVVPTMNSPTATRVDNGVPSNWGVYVKGFSKVTIAASGASGVYGSTIKSYSISGPGLSSTESSDTSSVLSESGTLTYKVTVTDSRGRTVIKSVSINVIDYSLPSINVNAVRCSSDGTSNKNGTYLKVIVNWNIASVSSKNSVSSKSVSCNGASKTDFSNGTAFVLSANCSIGKSYTLSATVTDALGNSASATVTISTSSRVMNVRKNKTGIAFGKFAETDDLFEVAWDAKFNGKLDGYSTGVTDYGDSTKKIQIGFAGAGLNTSNLSYIAGYTDNGTKIKDVSKSVLQSWLGVSDSDLLNRIYPVGSVYITYNNNNPGNFLGGTWEQFGQGRTLIGQGTGNDGSTSMSFNAESSGGEYKHKLSIEEMPSHSHYINGYSNAFGNKYYYNLVSGSNTYGSKSTNDTGGGKSHNNIQPYITVFFWRRTA